MSGVPFTITVGDTRVSSIGYDDVRPGDLLCSYEVLTTRPDFLFLERMQSLGSFSNRPELNRMFHAELIVETFSRKGVYRIAHADGAREKVLTQIDHIKEHHPGQAFLVFRARNEQLRREIASVGREVAKEDNGHLCKTLKFDSILPAIGTIFGAFYFENFVSRASKSTLRKVKEMVENFQNNGRFYRADGSGVQSMRCVELVANVVNVAAARVLHRPSEETLSECLNRLNESRDFPIHLSCSNATPASFVNFFLKHTREFATVGYLGVVDTKMNGPQLDIYGPPVKISSGQLQQALTLGNKEEFEGDIFYAAKVMKVLGLLSDSWELFPNLVMDREKIGTLLGCYFAKQRGTSLSKISSILPDVKEIDSIIRNLCDIIRQGGGEASAERVGALDIEEQEAILIFEKEVIKRSLIPRTDKTLKSSLNSLQRGQLEIQKTRQWARTLLQRGNFWWRTVAFAPLYFYFAGASRILEFRAFNREMRIKQIRAAILTAHERARKNACTTLALPGLDPSVRPWIHFSIDGGVTWDDEPFIEREGLWRAFFQLREKEKIIFRLFVGPKDSSEPQPSRKALAWTEVIRPKTIPEKIIIDGREYQNIFECRDPNWMNQKMLPHRQDFQQHEVECNRIAPTQDHPKLLSEYKASCQGLERELFSSPLEPSKGEIVIENEVQKFFQSKMGIHLSLDQIVLRRNGRGKGLSGDKLYTIYDNEQLPLFVVKVFTNSGKFFREYSTLLNHQTCKFPSLLLPEVQAAGVVPLPDKNARFLVMKHLEGDTLYDLFEDLLSFEPNSRERKAILDRLLKGYRKLAEALADLHSAYKSNPLPPHPLLLDLLQPFKGDGLRALSPFFDENSMSDLLDFFNGHCESEAKKKFIRGYNHGDLNVSNIIFNPVLGTISVVDWPDGSFTVGKDRTANGIPFCDLIQVENAVVSQQAVGLEKEEVSLLLTAFSEVYYARGFIKPSPTSKAFFVSVDLIGSIFGFLSREKLFAGDQLERARKIFMFNLEMLKKIVADPESIMAGFFSKGMTVTTQRDTQRC